MLKVINSYMVCVTDVTVILATLAATLLIPCGIGLIVYTAFVTHIKGGLV